MLLPAGEVLDGYLSARDLVRAEKVDTIRILGIRIGEDTLGLMVAHIKALIAAIAL